MKQILFFITFILCPALSWGQTAPVITITAHPVDTTVVEGAITGELHENGSFEEGETIYVGYVISGTAASTGYVGFDFSSSQVDITDWFQFNFVMYADAVYNNAVRKYFHLVMPATDVTDYAINGIFHRLTIDSMSASPAILPAIGGTGIVTVTGTSLVHVQIAAFDGDILVANGKSDSNETSTASAERLNIRHPPQTPPVEGNFSPLWEEPVGASSPCPCPPVEYTS